MTRFNHGGQVQGQQFHNQGFQAQPSNPTTVPSQQQMQTQQYPFTGQSQMNPASTSGQSMQQTYNTQSQEDPTQHTSSAQRMSPTQSVTAPAPMMTEVPDLLEFDFDTIRAYQSVGWHPAIDLQIPHQDFLRNTHIDLKELVSVKAFRTKKGKDVNMNYMAWTDAIRLLREYCPHFDCTLDLYRHPSGCMLPFVHIPDMGAMVSAFVFDRRTGRRTPSVYLAVRDFTLAGVPNPTIDIITNSQQRAIAKAIAQYTGIGWSLYADDESVTGLPNRGEEPNIIMTGLDAAMRGHQTEVQDLAAMMMQQPMVQPAYPQYRQ